MDIKELREKNPAELDRLLAEARNHLRELRFKVAAKQLADVREIRETRTTIAQILTVKGRAAVDKPAPSVAQPAADQPTESKEEAKS